MNTDTPEADAAEKLALEEYEQQRECGWPALYTGMFDLARKLERERDALKIEYESRAIWIEKMCKILGCENTDGFNCKDVHVVAGQIIKDKHRMDWLEAVGRTAKFSDGWNVWTKDSANNSIHKTSIRAAIDAAIHLTQKDL